MDALRLTAQRRPCDTRRRRACCALLSSACTRRLRQPGRPAPVVAGQVAVERAAGGTPVALRGSLAVHGVTTWFLVDLAAGRVLLRDARGRSCSVELAAAPEAVRPLAEAVRAAQSHGNGESIVRSSEVVAGPVRLSVSCSATPQRESAKFLVRIDEAALFERIRVMRASLDWHWLPCVARRSRWRGDDAATPG